MSSITTAIPTGMLKGWCVAAQVDFENNAYQCANATLGQKPSDYETICCDGDIIDTTQNLFQFDRPKSAGPLYVNIDNLVCCRLTGPQQGGIGPIDPDQTHCTAGDPTPLASLAATNVENAAYFPVTYTSASFGETTTGDFIPTQTPTCLWMNTNTAQSDGVAVVSVTVPAAHISTMPPATTDEFGFPISSAQTVASSNSTAYSTSSSQTTGSTTRSGSTTTTATPKSSAATRKRASYYSAGRILGIAVCTFLLHSLALA
jgi:hypothetical protein